MQTRSLFFSLILGSLAISAPEAISAPRVGHDAIGTKPDHSKRNNPWYTGEKSTFEFNGKTYKIGKVETLPSAPKTDSHSNPAGKTRDAQIGPESVITDAQGEEKLYYKKAAGTFLFFGELNLYEEDAFPASIVWGENNEVYVKDILGTYTNDTYIKGTLDGDRITFPTKQIIEYIVDEEYHEEYGIGIGIIRTEIDEEEDLINFYYDPSFESFEMTLNKKGGLDLVLPGQPFNGEDVPEYILGAYYTDEDRFNGFSDFFQTYTPTQLQTISMPFGVEPEPYVFIDEFDFADLVEVAYTDSYIYIRGLDPMIPKGVVRAKINGDTAVIDQNEYLGIYFGIHYIFTKVWLDNPDYDEADEQSFPYVMADPSVGFHLTFNREEGWIKADTPGVYLSFQPDENSLDNANCMISMFTLRHQESNLGTPANPTRLKYLYQDNLVAYYGYADFQFNISNYSTEGTLLDSDYLLYRIFVNGEPLVFRNEWVEGLNGEIVEAYRKVPGEQWWISFNFDNGNDITKFFTNEFDVGIYEPDVKTLGIQTMYIYPDSPVTYSQVVTLDVETGTVTVGPSSVTAVSDAPVVKTEFFNLSGQKVEKPSKGILIQRDIHSDGTLSSRKIIVN